MRHIQDVAKLPPEESIHPVNPANPVKDSSISAAAEDAGEEREDEREEHHVPHYPAAGIWVADGSTDLVKHAHRSNRHTIVRAVATADSCRTVDGASDANGLFTPAAANARNLSFVFLTVVRAIFARNGNRLRRRSSGLLKRGSALSAELLGVRVGGSAFRALHSRSSSRLQQGTGSPR